MMDIKEILLQGFINFLFKTLLQALILKAKLNKMSNKLKNYIIQLLEKLKTKGILICYRQYLGC